MGPTGNNAAGVGGQSFTMAAESIVFSPADTVLLKPGDTAVGTVVVQPDATYDVTLALVEGSVDAALSATVIRTAADGRGQFSIVASSVPASFGVRATTGTKSAILPVSVSNSGYATLKITGNYSGTRHVADWLATLKSGESCSTFGSSLPDDGAIFAESTASPPSIVVQDVPVGPTQSLVLRGDHSVWGCKDLPVLTSQEVLEVPVQLFDIPATYGPDPVPALFTISTNVDVWATNLASTKSVLIDAPEQSATSDIDLFLDKMRAATNDTALQADLDQRRINGNWHAILANQWATLDGSSDRCIATALDKWLSGAIATIAEGITFETSLTLISPSASPGQEQLNLKSMAGYPTDDYAPITAFPLSTTFGANDSLAASSAITFNEAHLLRSLAVTAARRQLPNSADVPNALASLLQCDILAANLNSAASGSSACDAACLTQLCSQATMLIWADTASAADQCGVTKLTLSCSGTLQLDAAAMVQGYSGNWLGLITSPSGNVSTGGTIG